MRGQEVRCFLHTAGLERHELDARNMIDGRLDLKEVERYDAVFMGGSGSYSLSYKRCQGIEDFLASLPDLLSMKKPLFGTCFGLHLLVEYFGGKIDKGRDGLSEIAAVDLQKAPGAEGDPVFGDLPDSFMGQMGHNDWVVEPPQTDTTVLVSNEASPYQALRFGDGPVYATQFHPELTDRTNKERYIRYAKNYAHDGIPDPDILNRFTPSPECNLLLRKFLAGVVL